jgi:hypothetical protein
MTRQPMTPLISESVRAQARADWEARFKRAEWVPSFTTDAGGQPARARLGWVCPACHTVEPSPFTLSLNHGYDPEIPGRGGPYGAGFGETCFKLHLQAAHAAFDARRYMVRYLAGEGLDDEQIAARVGWWDARTVAGYRKDDEKAARLAAKAAKGETAELVDGRLF